MSGARGTSALARCGALWALFGQTTNAEAADLLVDPGGAGDYVGIQEAIDAASDGDRVLVAPGTYPGGVDLRGKDIVLISTSGPSAMVNPSPMNASSSISRVCVMRW